MTIDLTPPAVSRVSRVMHELRARTLEVQRIEDVGRRMRRVVLGGAGLEPEFPWVPLAPGTHVKVVFPDAGEGAPRLPVVVDGRPRRDAAVAPVTARDYTVRAVDRDAHTISIDFVLHDHGPAGRWASAARPGDLLGVVGPRGSKVFPATASRFVVIADDTAHPVASGFVEGTFDGPMTLIRFGALDGLPPFAARDGLDLRVVPGLGPDIADAIVDVVDTLELPADAFVFAAGEAGTLAVVRRALRERIPRESLAVTGYWREGHAGLDHHTALPDD